jgi:phosphotriesterase-related protein
MAGKEAPMTSVHTVTGETDVSRLGRTLMHEHIFSFHSDMGGDYPWNEEEVFVAQAVDKLRRLKSAGFHTVVDLTVIGLGRNVRRVARVSRESGVNVIAATGIYASAVMPTYFRRHREIVGESFLEDFFVREVDEGIGETGIRASVLKCVTDVEGITPDVDYLLRATARCQLRTGVPISTHSNALAETGLLQQELFREEGVDLTKVIIGHSGESTDLDYLQRLLDAGSYLGMDRFGQYEVTGLEDRIDTIARLCDRGYADRIVLSHDTNCGGDVLPEIALTEWRLGHIAEVVLPAMRDRGISDIHIEQMLVDTPREIFARAGERHTQLPAFAEQSIGGSAA